MAELKAIPTELRSLVDSLQSLQEYCNNLKDGAQGFAHMLPAEWQGPAMNAFLAAFAAWEAGATALTEGAGSLREQAKVAADSYQSTSETLTTSWSTFRGQLG